MLTAIEKNTFFVVDGAIKNEASGSGEPYRTRALLKTRLLAPFG